MTANLVIVRGGGDLGSGIALRLWRCGFRVLILETANPVAVRRTVSFSEAVYDAVANVEEAGATLVDRSELRQYDCWHEIIPVVVDPCGEEIEALAPLAVVDAIMAKRNVGTGAHMAPIVVGVGPGFTAGEDVHAVVETNRGPNLGRVIWNGEAQPNTGQPGEVAGRGSSRVLRAPRAGTLRTLHSIGSIVNEGTIIAEIEGAPIRSSFRALVRGLARRGLLVSEGMKVGDIDPRLDPALCSLVSDKSLAVAGGVLEAILSVRARNKRE